MDTYGYSLYIEIEKRNIVMKINIYRLSISAFETYIHTYVYHWAEFISFHVPIQSKDKDKKIYNKILNCNVE